MKKPQPRRSVTLSEKDLALLEGLKEHYGATSLNDAIRRSVAQASVLQRYADKDSGELTIEAPDGTRVIVPSRI